MICPPCTARNHTDCKAPRTCPCQHRLPDESHDAALARLRTEAPHLVEKVGTARPAATA